MLMAPLLWLYPGVRVTVAESLIQNLGRVSERCDILGMKLNSSKTESMSLQVTHNASQVNAINEISGTVLKESDHYVIFGVTFDSKTTIEKHICLVSYRAAFQKLGILRKSRRVFHERSLLGDAFVVLPCQFWSTFSKVVLGYRHTY